MALYHSTFRWFAALSCKTTAEDHPFYSSLHLNYSMQNYISPMFCFSAHYEIVGDYEAISYQVTPNFLRARKHSNNLLNPNVLYRVLN